MKSKLWFTERIGTTVYPTFFDKAHPSDRATEAYGIRVENILHALYLFETQYEHGTLYTDKNA